MEAGVRIVREAVATYFSGVEGRAISSGFMTGDYEAHVAGVRGDAWGGQLELVAMSHLYKANILVWQLVEKTFAFCGPCIGGRRVFVFAYDSAREHYLRLQGADEAAMAWAEEAGIMIEAIPAGNMAVAIPPMEPVAEECHSHVQHGKNMSGGRRGGFDRV